MSEKECERSEKLKRKGKASVLLGESKKRDSEWGGWKGEGFVLSK